MKFAKIPKSHTSNDFITLKVCDTFFLRFKGLMFSKQLKPDEGLVLAEKTESKSATAIHMMFVNYDIAVLWLDKNLTIVDKVIAKRWALMYAPQKPAQYVVELHHSKFSDYAIGEQLALDFL